MEKYRKDSYMFVNLGDKKVPVSEIYKFIADRHIPCELIPVSDLRENDICRHWAADKYTFTDNGLSLSLFRDLSIGYLADTIRGLKDVDLINEKPIIVINRKHVLDGMHRLLKALVSNEDSIRAFNLYTADVSEFLKGYSK